ncbi:MAG: zinc-ribbon domain-containing protein [Phycisphaerales bacterium JB063]
MPASRESFDCPNCGEPVPGGALACPSCGADDETGWSEDTMYDGLDLPDEAFGDGPAKPTRQTAGYYRWVVVVMAALILLLLLGRWL